MKQWKVMIVDDEDIVVEDLCNLIDWSQNGFDIVATSTSTLNALELYKKYNPDIIFVDICMPIMDGLDFSKKILSEGNGTKIILLTAFKDFEYARKALEIGVYKYLLKHEIQRQTLLDELALLKKSLLGESGSVINKLDDSLMSYSLKTRRALAYIKENCEKDISIDTVSFEVGISKIYLCQILKKETNSTFLDWLTYFRIENAKKLLEQDKYTIYEIAEMIGYNSSQYFSKIFRKVTGKTPSEYKRGE